MEKKKVVLYDKKMESFLHFRHCGTARVKPNLSESAPTDATTRDFHFFFFFFYFPFSIFYLKTRNVVYISRWSRLSFTLIRTVERNIDSTQSRRRPKWKLYLEVYIYRVVRGGGCYVIGREREVMRRMCLLLSTFLLNSFLCLIQVREWNAYIYIHLALGWHHADVWLSIQRRLLKPIEVSIYPTVYNH